MLNLKLNVGVEIKDIQYPIRFSGRNICVHCGTEGSLVFVDAFGHETNKEIHAFDHIKCNKCKRLFSIMWDPDQDDSTKMVASAVAPSIKQDFLNLFKTGKSYDI